MTQRPKAKRLYYSLDELAEVLGCSRLSVDRMRYEGKLPIVKIGHLLRVPASALDDLAEEVA
jgi:excisionase family DNA binding protein